MGVPENKVLSVRMLLTMCCGIGLAYIQAVTILLQLLSMVNRFCSESPVICSMATLYFGIGTVLSDLDTFVDVGDMITSIVMTRTRQIKQRL